MKLELKHLKGYLDAGLKGQTIFLGEKNIYTISTDNVRSCFSPNNSIKPILYPLSYLTKEIEVNGEKFVPIEWLRKNINKKLRFSDNRFMDYDDGKSKNILHYSFYDIHSYTIDIEEVLQLIEKLYEWHFDIYGLIEKGLAIDKSTMQ